MTGPADRSGWVLVGVLAITETVSYGVLGYTFSVLLVPMQDELGWTIAQLSGCYTLALLVAACAAVPVGRWLDRNGPRALMTLGSTLATVLVLAWANVDTLPGLYWIWAGLGLAMSAVLYEPAFATITAWLPARQRDHALLAITVVAGFASTIFTPLAQWLVDSHGWRHALTVLAVVLGAFTVVPHALLLRRPDHLARPPGGQPGVEAGGDPPGPPSVPRQVALRRASFWWLTLSFTLAAFATSTISVHLVAALREQGHPAGTAAAAAGLLGAASVLGRILVTPAGRRWPRTHVTAIVLALQGLAVATLLGRHDLVALGLFVALFGAGRGILTLARATLVADFYGRAHYASISGTLALAVTTTSAIAPLGAGIMHARLGGYTPVLWLVAGTTTLAAVAMTLAHRQHASRRRPDRGSVPPGRPGLG